VFAEWVHRGKTDAEIAEYVGAQKFHRVYPDPENPAAIEELKRRMVNVREVKKGKGSVVAGINIVRELFKSNRLYISSECVNLIMGLETYSYAESKGERDPNENPAKENDDEVDACFIAGTLVVTDRGEIPIEKLMIGDYVLTRVGFRRITAVFSNGIKEVWDLGSITGTANHPIWKEGVGFVPLASLRYGDMIVTCTQTITEEKQEKFGNIKMVKSQEGIISTIRTATKAIMRLKILSVWRHLNIKNITGNKNLSLKKLVQFVQVNLKQNNITESFAQMHVSRGQGEEVMSILNIKTVKNVDQPLEQINIQRQDFAQNPATLVSMNEKSTQQSVGNVEKIFKHDKGQWHFTVAEVVKAPVFVGEKEVFNISVEGEEEYFANRMLVHNCRYALMMDAASSSRRTAEISFGTQKNYGEDEYAGITTEEFIPHRYEQ